MNDACSINGDVRVRNGGTLEVNENFCTTGDLDFAHATGSACSIDVAAGKSASFAGTCE